MKLAWIIPLAAGLLVAPLAAAAQEADLQWPQWRVELEGPSFSGPIVAGDRVIGWFKRQGFLDAHAAADMLAWENSGFSIDASVRITLLDRDVMPATAAAHMQNPAPTTPRGLPGPS